MHSRSLSHWSISPSHAACTRLWLLPLKDIRPWWKLSARLSQSPLCFTIYSAFVLASYFVSWLVLYHCHHLLLILLQHCQVLRAHHRSKQQIVSTSSITFLTFNKEVDGLYSNIPNAEKTGPMDQEESINLITLSAIIYIFFRLFITVSMQRGWEEIRLIQFTTSW